jgi:hypothetical protein
MSCQITRGELAELSSKLPKGSLRDWCDQSASGPQTQIVFADSEMLSRCQQAASSSKQEESKPKESKKKCKVSKTMKDIPGTSL